VGSTPTQAELFKVFRAAGGSTDYQWILYTSNLHQQSSICSQARKGATGASLLDIASIISCRASNPPSTACDEPSSD
jgi:hypothetical protein